MAAPWQVTGTTDIAPHSPVADWRCVAEGEGYGNYYDPISQQYATVTRATPKTARTADGRIVDVPAGKLALEPWSLHKEGGIGYAAIIEESRTNYLTNSYGAANDGEKWTTGWVTSKNVAGAIAYGLVDGVYRGTSQRIAYVSSGDTNSHITRNYSSAVGSFAAGEAATFSAYLSGSSSGVSMVMRIGAYASGSFLGTVATPEIVLSSRKARYTLTYSNLPVGTSYLIVYPVYITGIDTGDMLDITIDACQLEKGSFATSYIPTTTAAATRNRDVVGIPTTRWNADAGTFLVVGLPSSSTVTGHTAVRWGDSDTDYRWLQYWGPQGIRMLVKNNSILSSTPIPAFTPYSPHAFVGVWQASSKVSAYIDGAQKKTTTDDLPASLNTPTPATAYIGQTIARLTVYDKALSDEQLAAADMTTDLLTGIEGVAAPALAADWRVIPTGLGYGNYYDSVTKQWATVTRTTPKTAQIAPNRIVDVPAGQLAVVPWSLHKSGGTGYAAVIEEARTNYLVNSYGAANTGGAWDGANLSFNNAVSTNTVVAGPYGNAQRRAVQGTGAGGYVNMLFDKPADGTFAAGGTAVGSCRYRGSVTGSAKAVVRLLAYDASDALLGSSESGSIPLSQTAWNTANHAYASLPANTAYVRANFRIYAGTGDTATIDTATCQLEKGSFATSYIPTTTAAATRNGDVVRVPTTGWNASKGTAVVAHAGQVGWTSALWSWYRTSSQYYMLYETTGAIFSARTPIATKFDITYENRAVPHVLTGRWSVGEVLRVLLNGSAGGRADVLAEADTALLVGYIGSGYASANTPIARVTVYATALTDAQIQSAELTTELLKGLDTSKLTKEMILDETRASYSAVYISG